MLCFAGTCDPVAMHKVAKATAATVMVTQSGASMSLDLV